MQAVHQCAHAYEQRALQLDLGKAQTTGLLLCSAQTPAAMLVKATYLLDGVALAAGWPGALAWLAAARASDRTRSRCPGAACCRAAAAAFTAALLARSSGVRAGTGASRLAAGAAGAASSSVLSVPGASEGTSAALAACLAASWAAVSEGAGVENFGMGAGMGLVSGSASAAVADVVSVLTASLCAGAENFGMLPSAGFLTTAACSSAVISSTLASAISHSFRLALNFVSCEDTNSEWCGALPRLPEVKSG